MVGHRRAPQQLRDDLLPFGRKKLRESGKNGLGAPTHESRVPRLRSVDLLDPYLVGTTTSPLSRRERAKRAAVGCSDELCLRGLTCPTTPDAWVPPGVDATQDDKLAAVDDVVQRVWKPRNERAPH